MITASTIPTFLFGHPAKHSKSPVFQNAAFKASDIDSVYLALDIEKNNFALVMNGLKNMEILGANITIPYKKDIMQFCDVISEEAKQIDAVNTIVAKDGKWIGYNTDWFGVFKTLEENAIDSNLNVLVIGAGGATNGLIYGLQQYGFKKISITNRTIEKAKIIADRFNITLCEDYKAKIDDFTLVINSTSIIFDNLVDSFNDDVVYFDLKYYTEALKIKNYIDGSKMLLYQGAKSFEYWTGKKAPVDVMKGALLL